MPDCSVKVCGDDGCGGSCGDCAPGEECSVDGLCVPLSGSCEGNCGGQAPTGCWCDSACFGNDDCCDDVCDFCAADYPDDCCVPDCAGKDCGADGCGGSCGDCAPGEVCTAEGLCEAPAQTSCDGNCGNYDGNVDSCQCDGECFDAGDCCDDICTFCDDAFPEGCPACEDGYQLGCDGVTCYLISWIGDGICDAGYDCLEFQYDGGDCVEASDSCEGNCGVYDGEAACQCDAACFDAGDCCEDICDTCAADFVDECCVPDCADLECGDDGCGGSCGDCAPGETCTDGVCEPPPQTSCDGNCGIYDADGLCQCDSSCFEAGDCCDDVCDFCAGDYPDDCAGGCDPDQVLGCDGQCWPAFWLGDGICDTGLNCAEHNLDDGD